MTIEEMEQAKEEATQRLRRAENDVIGTATALAVDFRRYGAVSAANYAEMIAGAVDAHEEAHEALTRANDALIRHYDRQAGRAA